MIEAERLTQATLGALRDAGWSPERRVDPMVFGRVVRWYDPNPEEEIAREVLSELGGLTVRGVAFDPREVDDGVEGTDQVFRRTQDRSAVIGSDEMYRWFVGVSRRIYGVPYGDWSVVVYFCIEDFLNLDQRKRIEVFFPECVADR
ncbi:MAG TPA: hypothetical protein VNC50_18325 [Planctomycetia bacterium]|nr:hypothetical protein [Planctomycetia bacterium]